jgi:hypothetical protein
MLRRTILLLVAGAACGGSDDSPGLDWLAPDEWDPLACAWEDRVVGAGGVADWAGNAALTSDDGVVVAGAIHPSAEEERSWFRRYSATGEVVWTTDTVLAGFRGGVSALALDHRDRIGLTGGIVADDATKDVWVAELEATGELAWSIDVGLVGSGKAACFAPDGELYVTGEIADRADSSASDIWIGKLAADGTLLWDHTELGPPGRNQGGALVCDPSGGVVVLGALIGDGGHYESWIGRFDPVGDALWTTIIAGSPEQALLSAGDEVLVAVHAAGGKRLHRIALSDGAIRADLPAPEQFILAADAGGTFVSGNFALDGAPGCQTPAGDPCELIPYWGYAYYDWDAQLVW